MNFINGDQNYFAPFKKHEFILNNKSDSFENKIESLIDVWKSIGELNLCQFDLRHVIQIMDWAKLHALNIVLTAEWNSFKATYQSKLLEEIEKAQNELLKLNSAFATRCKKLADVVRNPWEDPILMNLMKTNDAEIGPEEIEFFCVETAYLVSVRLKKLCESHCEDLALNLVTAFMNCNKLSKKQNFSLNATETQMWFIFDIYIALLYKFQERQKIVVLLKELTFGEGLQLVNRFAKKRVKISKIWKNCQRVAILAAQMYISQAVVKYTDELKEFLESYLEVYISLCNSDALLQDFSTSIRRISNLADAAGLYVFCAVIQRKAGHKLKPFVIEMYIRALTTDMNELERQKDANELEKVAAITSRLAEAFCNLADFLSEHVKVARECVLTAFSLEPSKERLSNIEMLAKRSGFVVLDTGQEWKCKLHPPILPSDEITWMCPECGDWMSKPEFNVPIKINMALNEALQNSILGISEALCDDLVVCLSNPRYQILSWFLPWEELHRLCVMYLQDPQATKNIVTELKFVDIDYSIFKGIKREPLDELDGIERGYEQYLDQDFVSDEETSSNSEDSMSQDSRPYSLGSDGAGEGPYLPMLPAQTKSDPNTLKSLRMFRPNLKRIREKETCEETPEKLFKSDTDNSIIPSSVSSSKVENPSTEDYANKIAPKVSAIQYPKPLPATAPIASSSKSCDNDFSSKNVMTATLPLLGGQVAKKKKTLTQVKKLDKKQKPKASIPPLKNSVVTKKCQQTKTQNKLSKNGSKENNNCKLVQHKAQDFRLPSPGLKIHTHPTRPTKKHRKFSLELKIPLMNFIPNKDSSKKDMAIQSDPPNKSLSEISRSRQLFKLRILNKLAKTSEQANPSLLIAESSRQLPTNNHPGNTSINIQLSSSSCPLPQNQTTEEIKSENHQSNYLRSSIPLLNPTLNMSQQKQPKLIKQEQNQTPNRFTVTCKVVNNQESSQNSSYRCHSPPNIVQQPAKPHPDMLRKLIIKIPVSRQMINKKEPPEKKLLEICSNQSLISPREQSQEQAQQVISIKQDHTLLKLIMPSLLPKSDNTPQPPPPLTLNHQRLLTLLQSNNLPKETAVKLNTLISQEPVPLNTNNKTSQVNLSTNQAPNLQNHQMSLIHNSNPTSQPTVLQSIKQEPLTFKFNYPGPQSPKLEDKKPIIYKTDHMVHTTTPTPSNNSQLLSTIRLENPQTKYSIPIISNQHQNTSEMLENQQSQWNPYTSQSSSQPQSTISKDQCTTNEQPAIVQKQNKNQRENQQAKQLINKNLLHNNFCSSLKVPSPCLNLDKLPIFHTNPRVILHRLKDHTVVEPNKIQVLRRSQHQSTKTPFSTGTSDKEQVLVRADNLKSKQETTNKKTRTNKKLSRTAKKNLKRVYQMQKNSYNSLDITRSKNDSDKADVYSKCNNDSISNVISTEKNGNEKNNNNNDTFIINRNSKMTAQIPTNGEDFFETCPEELLCDTSLKKKEFQENDDPHEVLPKTNLTDKIRTYPSKRKILAKNKDCVKTPTGVDVLDDCKNVNNINSTENLHSTVQNSLTNPKELKIILCRLPLNKKIEGKCASNKDEYPSIKQKCDRGKTPQKNSRKRKCLEKSENKVGKAPNLVQNHILSPLQDVNLRVNSQINTKACCDLSKEEIKPDKSQDKKSMLKSVLSNIPGLNDFQMIRPLEVNQVVNVVQVSGGRPTQGVSIQNSQTSTQVTPHIQRIGQPKPEHSNSITSTTQTPTTSAPSRITTSQPSTLINILSQQMVRPVSNQANTVRRQGPLINVLSQQVIRPIPSLTPKTPVNSITPSPEAIQVQNPFKWCINAMGLKTKLLMKIYFVF